MLIAWPAYSQEPTHADDRLREIYTTEWAWRKNQLVDREDWSIVPGERIPDHLPKVDPATQQMRLHYWVDIAGRLGAISRSELTGSEQLNYDVYRFQVEALVADQRLRDYEMPINSDSAFWGAFNRTARRPFQALEDYRNWISQMRDIPRYFREQTVEMRAGLKRGFTPSRVSMEGRERSLNAVTDVAPEATLFYLPFQKMPESLAEQQEALRAEGVRVIREVVQPAYAELFHFMRTEYLPHLRTTTAAQDLPNGVSYYRAKIHEYTTLDMDPATIHALGEAEVARLHEEMLVAMKQTGYEGEFQAFLQFLREDPQFYVKSPEELLMRAEGILQRFDAKGASYFGYLPRTRIAIQPMPDDVAPFYSDGRGAPGLFLVNTYKLSSRPLYGLVALTLHEGAPGHAFQMPIALEHSEQPEFRRRVYLAAYSEGWALYCEKLGLEMGMYETPYERFGMLGFQVWRAARLVVDTGIHSQGWGRNRAVTYLRKYTALSEHQIETEVDRYISWPGQALSYYLGELSIVQARANAERALKDKFNIRAFHDVILELGAVPLSVLKSRIDRFILDGGQGPYPELE
jgi:uncharacterized protein (DUF885 family)